MLTYLFYNTKLYKKYSENLTSSLNACFRHHQYFVHIHSILSNLNANKNYEGKLDSDIICTKENTEKNPTKKITVK